MSLIFWYKIAYIGPSGINSYGMFLTNKKFSFWSILYQILIISHGYYEILRVLVHGYTGKAHLFAIDR